MSLSSSEDGRARRRWEEEDWENGMVEEGYLRLGQEVSGGELLREEERSRERRGGAVIVVVKGVSLGLRSLLGRFPPLVFRS